VARSLCSLQPGHPPGQDEKEERKRKLARSFRLAVTLFARMAEGGRGSGRWAIFRGCSELASGEGISAAWALSWLNGPHAMGSWRFLCGLRIWLASLTDDGRLEQLRTAWHL